MASQGLEYAITGTWDWSWNDFFYTAVGGAVGGIVAYCFNGWGLAAYGAFASGFASNATMLIMEDYMENKNYTVADVLVSSILVGTLSALSAGMMDKIRISGLNAGRGSFSSISSQIYTKFYRGHIYNITMKTLGKMVTVEFYGSIAGFWVDQMCSQINFQEIVLSWN